LTRRSRAREIALQLLFERDHNRLIDRAAAEDFVRNRLRETELADFALRIYDSVLANMKDIDSRLAAAAENWRLPRMAAVDRNILRMGACELLFLKEAPPAVAFDEAIELARRYGSADSPAFVNGVLDRLRREAETPPQKD
jgi:N utilization substance protein B